VIFYNDLLNTNKQAPSLGFVGFNVEVKHNDINLRNLIMDTNINLDSLYKFYLNVEIIYDCVMAQEKFYIDNI